MAELTSRSSAVFLVLVVSAAACGGPRKEGIRTAPEPVTPGETRPLEPGTSARSTGGRYPYTEADVQFMSHMIRHHSQALVMAGWAPSHGAGPEVRRLAERIVNGQQDEIASMQRWLQDRGEPAPDSGTAEMHSEHPSPSSGHDHRVMPGMLTDAQMKELDHARGREFDRLFLTYMIQHHQGAVTMVQDLFSTPGAAREETTFKLASDISADQSSEIKRMQRMLASLDGRSS
jgi:uncharacterized protein (DUF305 family)